MRNFIALPEQLRGERKHSPRGSVSVVLRRSPSSLAPGRMLGNPTAAAMPLAHDRLEVLQVRKLVQCVRTGDKAQITKLVQHGISGLINYQGEGTMQLHTIKHWKIASC